MDIDQNLDRVTTAEPLRGGILLHSPNHVSASFTLTHDRREYEFHVRDLSAPAFCGIQNWPDDAIQEIGCPADLATDSTARATWLDEHAHDILTADTPLLQAGRVKPGTTVLQASLVLLEELWHIAFCDCVVNVIEGTTTWAMQEPRTPETLKLLLPLAIKRKLHEKLLGIATMQSSLAASLRFDGSMHLFTHQADYFEELMTASITEMCKSPFERVREMWQHDSPWP